VAQDEEVLVITVEKEKVVVQEVAHEGRNEEGTEESLPAKKNEKFSSTLCNVKAIKKTFTMPPPRTWCTLFMDPEWIKSLPVVQKHMWLDIAGRVMVGREFGRLSRSLLLGELEARSEDAG
jgi:hypothetical protein